MRTSTGLSQRITSVCAVWLVFVAYAGLSPPPDVNETHYLTKAKHFWNPQWCANDLFLSSEQTHWIFYAATGWLTRLCSLEAYAWIGRFLTWLWLAAAWCRLVGSIVPGSGTAIWTAPLVVVLIDKGNLAGEWLVGGFEAKCIAYGFVFWALTDGCLGRWRCAWLAAGAAAGIHLIVGFWSALALVCCRITDEIRGRPDVENDARLPRSHTWQRELVAVLFGLVFALPGLIPPLIARIGVDGQTMAEAAEIQVRYRLAHHQFFPSFEIERVASFCLLLAISGVFHSFTRNDPRLRIVRTWVLASIAFSIGGIVWCAVADHASSWSPLAWSMLRLYWFRLADIALPVFVVLALAGMFSSRRAGTGGRLATDPWFLGCLVLIWVSFGWLVIERHGDRRPRADQAALPSYQDDPRRTWETYLNWRLVCDWIRTTTPPDAGFFTPPAQQSFKWYAHRREVYCWKDMPQDDRSIVEWWRRAAELYFGPRDWADGWFTYTDEELIDLAVRYNAQYLVLPQKDYESRPSRLTLVYPEDPAKRSTYVVVRLEPPSGPNP